MSNDLIDHQQSGDALKHALAYAENIIATLREPFLVLSGDLRVKTANRSFFESFHVSKEETENRLVYELGNGQWDIPLLRTLLNEVLSVSHPVHDFEVEHTFPDIGQRTMLLNARKFSPEPNTPPLILLAIEDVTERRRLERQMQEQAAALADLDHRKDEFLAMLSHELRNPLAPILNALQLLQLQKSDSPVQQKAQAIIERQVGQLTHLVDDLLDVSRTVTGRIQLRREKIAVSDIVERAVETVRPLIDQRKHELTVSLSPDPIWLFVDADRLEQVATNLLTNAAKYTNEGGHIWLSVQQEGEEAVLRVRDTGLGIAPTFLPHVFDLFTQAERSSDRLQGGLGIGLALVKRLVEMHEGTIGVFSTLGQGSEFVVSLPVELPMPLSQRTQPPPHEIAKPTGVVLRVLIVDDNVDATTALELLLQASGHDVRVAHTGLTGLAAALDFRPDVTLLDIGLPELNGWKVAKRIRQQPILHDIVLVAMTGYAQNADRQRSRRAGFDHHLVKPVDFGRLREILAAVSEKAHHLTEPV